MSLFVIDYLGMTFRFAPPPGTDRQGKIVRVEAPIKVENGYVIPNPFLTQEQTNLKSLKELKSGVIHDGESYQVIAITEEVPIPVIITIRKSKEE